MVIKIKDFIHGSYGVLHEEGEECAYEILKYIDDEDILLDFGGVIAATSSFLYPIISEIIMEKGKAAIEKVEIRSNNTIRKNFEMIKNGELRRAEKE
nr:MAG TPA: protein of unknown function DUF4325 [Caudoviricetes sp.]